MLFLTALVAGGLWLRFTEQQQLDRRSAEWASALDIVEERFAVARAAAPGDLGPWETTRAALDAALAQSTAGGRPDVPPTTVHPALWTRTEQLRQAVTSEHAAAIARAERDAADEELRARLEEIRAPTGDGLDPWDYPRMERAYRALFQELDLDVTEYDATAAKLKSHRLGEDLALALDEWSLLHHVLARQPERERTVISTRLLWLAVYADSSKARNAIRQAIIADDVETLESLAANVEDIPPESAVLVAGCLRLLGRIESAIEVIRRMIRLHPDDYWLSFQGAIALRSLAAAASRTDREALLHESVSYFRGALAARPNSLQARHLLGQALNELGQWDAARGEFEELVRREPDNGHWRAHVGQCIARVASYAASLSVVEEAARLAPDDAWALDLHALALLDGGNPWAALDLRRRAWELQQDGYYATRYAESLGRVGDLAGDWRMRQKAVELAPDQWRTHYGAAFTAGTFALREPRLGFMRRAVELAPARAEVHCNLADVLREMGRFEEALASYRRGHELGSSQPGWSYPSARWVAETEKALALTAELDRHEARGVANLEDTDALFLAEVALQSGHPALASDWYATLHARMRQLGVQDLDLALEAAARALADAGPATDIGLHRDRALRWMEETRGRLMADFRSHPRREQAAVRTWLMSWQLNPLLAPLRHRVDWPTPLEDRAAAIWRAVGTDLAELEAAVARLADGG